MLFLADRLVLVAVRAERQTVKLDGLHTAHTTRCDIFFIEYRRKFNKSLPNKMVQ